MRRSLVAHDAFVLEPAMRRSSPSRSPSSRPPSCFCVRPAARLRSRGGQIRAGKAAPCAMTLSPLSPASLLGVVRRNLLAAAHVRLGHEHLPIEPPWPRSAGSRTSDGCRAQDITPCARRTRPSARSCLTSLRSSCCPSRLMRTFRRVELVMKTMHVALISACATIADPRGADAYEHLENSEPLS